MSDERKAIKLSVKRKPYSSTHPGTWTPLTERDFPADAHAHFVGYRADPQVRVTWATKGDRRQAFEITLTRRHLIDMLTLIEDAAATGPNPRLEITQRPIETIK
jgi:hypothetical protein